MNKVSWPQDHRTRDILHCRGWFILQYEFRFQGFINKTCLVVHVTFFISRPSESELLRRTNAINRMCLMISGRVYVTSSHHIKWLFITINKRRLPTGYTYYRLRNTSLPDTEERIKRHFEHVTPSTRIEGFVPFLWNLMTYSKPLIKTEF